LFDLIATPTGSTLEWMIDQRHRKSLPHRLERQGYAACRNPNESDGLWRLNGKRVRLYARTNMPSNEWFGAASAYLLRMTKVNGNS
jgi:hypothetical protein